MKPPLEVFLATVLPRPADARGIRGQFAPNLFCASPNFVVLRKIWFNPSPLRMYFDPQTLKPG